MTVEAINTIQPQPQFIVVPSGGQSGGGMATRLGGAVLASCLISGIGYMASYSPLVARLVLRHQGATVEMPAEQAAEPKRSVVERSRSVLADSLTKIKDQLAKTKESTTGGIDKAKQAAVSGLATATKTGAKLGHTIGDKVDKTAEGLKAMLAHRQEEAKKKRDEDARLLAIEMEKYKEAVRRYLAHYNAQCPNPKCGRPLGTKGLSKAQYVGCARCRMRFTVGRARALGPPPPPSFQARHRMGFA